MSSDAYVTQIAKTNLMHRILLCFILFFIANDAAPAPELVSDLAGAARGLGRSAGDIVKAVPIVGGLAAPFVDGARFIGK